MERTEWPTRSYLDELREQGKVAFSRLASASFVTIAALLSSLLVMRLFGTFVRDYFAQGTLSLTRETSILLFEMAALPPLAVMVAALAGGLLQTRGLLHFDLSINIERMGAAGRLHPARLLWAIIAGISCAIFATLVGVGSFILLARSSLAWLVVGRNMPDGIGWFTLSRFVIVCMPGLIACLVFGWLLSGLIFRYTHRMTRAEVEAEFRGSI